MAGLYKDEGVVLKTIKLGEADRIVTVFTRGAGKVAGVAKGIRRTKSRFGGRLEPFTQVDLVLYRGRNLDTITQVHILESFRPVRADYQSLTAASALVELVDKVTPEREKAYPVYSLLVSGLQALAAGNASSVVAAFAVKLLSVSGYHPQLMVCAGCGNPNGLGGFSAALGGVVCESCWREDRGALRVSPDRIALMAHLLEAELGEGGDPGAVREVTQILRCYAEYHLERPLRSLALLPGS